MITEFAAQPVADPMVLFELETDFAIPDDGRARAGFEQLGLDGNPSIWMPLNVGGFRCFKLLRLPVSALPDCKLIVRNDAVVAALHGTDCNMVEQIRNDLGRGSTSELRYCSRRQAGGSFAVIDIAEMR